MWLVLRRTAAERAFFRFRGERREGVASQFARIDAAALIETEAGAKGRVKCCILVFFFPQRRSAGQPSILSHLFLFHHFNEKGGA